MFFGNEFYNCETICKSEEVPLNICELCFKTNIVTLDKLRTSEIGIQCSDSNCKNKEIKYMTIPKFINLLEKIKESKNEKYPTPEKTYGYSKICYYCFKNKCGSQTHPYVNVGSLLTQVNEIIEKVEEKKNKNEECLKLLENLYNKSKQLFMKKIKFYENIQNLIEIFQENYRYREYDISNLKNLIQCLSLTFPNSEKGIYDLLQNLDREIDSYSKKQITLSEINIKSFLFNFEKINDISDIIKNLKIIHNKEISFYSNSYSSTVIGTTSGNLRIKKNNQTRKYSFSYSISYATWISEHALAFGQFNNAIGVVTDDEQKKIIEGHDDRVNKVITLKDNVFASCSNDKKIKIWKLKCETSINIEQLSIIEAHSDWVNSIILLKKHNYLVSGSAGEDNSVKIFDLSDGNKCINVFENVECCSKNSLDSINEEVILVGGLNKVVCLNIITMKEEMSITTDGYVTCFFIDEKFIRDVLYGFQNKIYHLNLNSRESKPVIRTEGEICYIYISKESLINSI